MDGKNNIVFVSPLDAPADRSQATCSCSVFSSVGHTGPDRDSGSVGYDDIIHSLLVYSHSSEKNSVLHHSV
ncbi:hypothetical protein E2C01_003149 [Portunus trituberculatus]|uniref:Uncharacterized protein n=1 Tax=Portunus trituberculatus TaxID=210409 RepID=A0A5B7CLF3_PORTR|nr:hypothetical protein [Portunus trituberculatus]